MDEDERALEGADVVRANAFRVEELREALTGRSQRVSKELAIALLRMKDYPEDQKVADLAGVLTNDQEPPRTRVAAAIELGRLGSSEAAGVLRSALETVDPALESAVRSALQPSAEKGTAQTRAAAEPLEPTVPQRYEPEGR